MEEAKFQALYKQTFAQVRCPARAAQNAAETAARRPRHRYCWLILAAPLLLAAGLLGQVEFTDLHQTPHPSFAPDAVGGYALTFDLTEQPYSVLSQELRDLDAAQQADPEQANHFNPHYILYRDDISRQFANCGETSVQYGENDWFKDLACGADSAAQAAELTGLPLLENPILAAQTDIGYLTYYPDLQSTTYRDGIKKRVAILGWHTDGDLAGLAVSTRGELSADVLDSPSSLIVYVTALAKVAPDDRAPRTIDMALTFDTANRLDGWDREEYKMANGDVAVIPLYGANPDNLWGTEAYFVHDNVFYQVSLGQGQQGGASSRIGDTRLRPYLKQILDAFA